MIHCWTGSLSVVMFFGNTIVEIIKDLPIHRKESIVTALLCGQLNQQYWSAERKLKPH